MSREVRRIGAQNVTRTHACVLPMRVSETHLLSSSISARHTLPPPNRVSLEPSREAHTSLVFPEPGPPVPQRVSDTPSVHLFAQTHSQVRPPSAESAWSDHARHARRSALARPRRFFQAATEVGGGRTFRAELRSPRLPAVRLWGGTTPS